MVWIAETPVKEGVSIDAQRTDVLIIGCGPAGASLACFLASYGIEGVMVSRSSSTADTPRAHITNMAALECLRDVGLEEECIQVATKGDCMTHTRWCHSMAGEEYARVYSWGNDPARMGDYEAASPCSPMDLPQTLLEPILVRHATTKTFKCRWNTSFVAFEDLGEGKGVITTLRDDLIGQEYRIHSKYLFGADGARSRVLRQLGLPLLSKPGGGLAINVLVKADLTQLIAHRKGNLHWVMQPDKPRLDFGQMAIVRMVKPWHEWMFILLPKVGWTGPEPSQDEYLRLVKDFIGANIPATILSIAKWNINETVADQYSRGNVFCLGDAVHRHPPFNGLGSNTCIQDAFNLAWKVAYVESGVADRSLLSSYSIERQPVGQSVVTRANEGFREHYRVWEAIGMLSEDISERTAILQELYSPTAEGRKRRRTFRSATEATCHEFHGLGIEMNQTYTGPAIYHLDEEKPFHLCDRALLDPILYHMRSTYPGRRLPHAWLNKQTPVHAPVSTIDLAGKGYVTLFTGVGGSMWRKGVEKAMAELPEKLQLQVVSIGPGQDWEDIYDSWAQVRGIEEDGAVLVRPDRFVAWRSQQAIVDEEACGAKLLHVMRMLLGWI